MLKLTGETTENGDHNIAFAFAGGDQMNIVNTKIKGTEIYIFF